MSDQPDLFASQSAETDQEVRRLVKLLAQDGGWMTARHLARILGTDDRTVRRLAQQSDGLVVSGPGCPGYRHLDQCTTEEIAHTADRLRSQGLSMLARSIRLRRRAHETIR